MLAMAPLPAPAQSVDIAIVDVVSVAKGYRVSKARIKSASRGQLQKMPQLPQLNYGKDQQQKK
jgi:hypothetical protein